MTEIFESNRDLFAKSDPRSAFMLSYVSLEGIDLDTVESPASFKEWKKTFQPQDAEVVYLFGLGQGLALEVIRQTKKRLVVLESDVRVVRAFFERKEAEGFLNDPLCKLVIFQDFEDPQFEGLYWEFAMKRFYFTMLQSYQKKGRDLKEKIAFDNAVKNALVEEYMKCGGSFFINYYQNILQLPGAHSGDAFFGKFRGVPAIICGAGPSLGKNVEALKDYFDKALIFGGGSAVNVLNAHGILPHFGVGIDPNPMQLERLKSNTSFGTPYFYRNRMYHEAMMAIKGPRLYVTGSSGYRIAEYFERELGIEGVDLEEGHNVVNFAIELSLAMGCNPIILAGLDLAYTEMKAYAPGVVENVDVDLGAIIDTGDYDTNALVKSDIEGKPIYTLWKWIAEAEWISKYANEHSVTTFVNATEGGLGIKGVPNMALKDVGKAFFKKTFDVDSLIQTEMTKAAMPWVTKQKVGRALRKLQKSLRRCADHLNVLWEDAGREKDQVQSGLAALAEVELEEEDGWIFVIDIFNEVSARLLNRDLIELKNNPKLTDDERYEGKLKLNRKRLKFLESVARVNADLIDHAYAKKRKITQ